MECSFFLAASLVFAPSSECRSEPTLINSGVNMGIQDEQRDDLLASEVIIALTDLARLAQQASSVAVDAPELFAGLLLERLLALCAAQCGALFLTTRNNLLPGQELLSAALDSRRLRTLALRNMSEEKAQALLAVSPDGEALVQDFPTASCWLGTCFPLTTAFSPQQDGLRAEFSSAAIPAGAAAHSIQVVLLLGWTGLKIEQSLAVVEKARGLLSRVADSVEAAMLNMLLTERVRDLEVAMERGALHEMELLKAELLATVSHELRSPLASIKGYASTLLRHGRRISPEERHEFLLAISGASNRLETSINRLLETSELETGAIHIERSPTDVGHLAREAITAVEQRVAARTLERFTFNLRLGNAPNTVEPGEFVIMADQRRMREVFDQLLENAMNYSPDGGAIDVIVRFVPLPAAFVVPLPAALPQTVVQEEGEAAGADASEGQAAAQSSGQALEICICDNGMGIPPEHLDRIFERFHRVDNGLTREVNGLGLGLTICKRIVELHQGLIWAESCPAGGSAFHVLLPAGEEEEIPAPHAGAKVQ